MGSKRDACAVLAVMLEVLAAAALVAETGAPRRVPITDPDELVSMGMARDARNVFRWVPPEVEAGRSKSAPATVSPKTWGTAEGFATVSPMDLVAEHQSPLFRYPERTYCSLGAGGQGQAQEALAQVDLPAGGALDYLAVWGYDEEPTYGMTVTVYEFCQAVGDNPPTTTLIGSIGTLGSGGYTYDATPLYGYPVNNRDCGYSVRVMFIPGNATCRSDQIQFRKASLLWHRQVGAAPLTATFTDVPASHPFFQFVEALAQSGITGGCGNGNFCPDAPLTRGQMAVFLAKALGMGWR